MKNVKPAYFYPVPYLQWVIGAVAWLLVRIGGKIEFVGREHIAEVRGPVIFAANHTGDWDAPLIRRALSFSTRFRYLFFVSNVKKYYQTDNRNILQKLLYGGFIFKLIGAYPVYRDQSDFKVTFAHHLHILAHGGNVVIFPEGRSVKEGVLGPFKRGVVVLARMSGAPIVPVAVQGLADLTSARSLLRKRTYPVRISFGSPIEVPMLPEGNIPDEEMKAIDATVDTVRSAVLSMTEAR